ncbi:hypothetical protein [Colwellia ponticola]|uniref:Uncharacterized protein n=1 Tax=Colwellia ponticola TaxID=2304625 RepID=A0A8H2JPR1_9GAMM|nr:hypothetical protein [Colwellia ponticola]TMM45476.1 hypothetical protein FCS21_08835 [Colwellia ponticola]
MKSFSGKVLIEEHGYSGECAPVFSNKLPACSGIVKINNAAGKPLPFIRYSPLGTCSMQSWSP